ncbi:MAG: fibronectin, partial [Candidatus Marinimicrobia bacterium]|nr:fibronectin [Candidatus Neomarinimicrobiota bacterium]
GDSIKIVLVEAIGILSWEKRQEIGLNWCQRANFSANSLYTGIGGSLALPGGGSTTNIDDYKRAWVMTGKDSLFLTFQRAIDNYNDGAGYTVAIPPPPPSRFSVLPGGDRVVLEWEYNAETYPTFSGYRVYRALQEPDSTYHLIFECGGSTGISVTNTFQDRSAIRGFSYYYYIESYDDGSTGKELVSSKFHTMTNESASLQRPAGTILDDIRVVPNPYNRRARTLQYGETTADKNKINFYGLPPQCDIIIYSERGDLIKTINHTFPTGDESWDLTTDTNQLIKTGIYIARIVVTEEVIDEQTGIPLLRLGDATHLKFIVIR